ncbi:MULTISPECIES: cbb3-type cytochrome c oxidase subunit 3 [Novosphingobium]|uniref:Cytochrome c oxidase cbb3-type subunit 4 n=1 Tax=Novosphingobium panipatense TaxID=428991 RepID=A0ABY1QY17_9SPHN|nr:MULTISPECIES: cbb3-type cytochrome c oxidase subunit 3 [Novosphingobium]SMP82078.1 cytochrome c oxidase cbb3-type subunit 4 [Novosphingobium panipatense]
MSTHSTYDLLRHFADSWGLLVMLVIFLVLAAWPLRPGQRGRNETAATMIFKDENDG